MIGCCKRESTWEWPRCEYLVQPPFVVLGAGAGAGYSNSPIQGLVKSVTLWDTQVCKAPTPSQQLGQLQPVTAAAGYSCSWLQLQPVAAAAGCSCSRLQL